jgi:hypothetical protein
MSDVELHTQGSPPAQEGMGTRRPALLGQAAASAREPLRRISDWWSTALQRLRKVFRAPAPRHSPLRMHANFQREWCIFVVGREQTATFLDQSALGRHSPAACRSANVCKRIKRQRQLLARSGCLGVQSLSVLLLFIASDRIGFRAALRG